MFGKNKNNSKNPFGDKGYTMKDYYKPENLIVAKFQRRSNIDTEDSFTPMVKTTNQIYIFEIIFDKNEKKYREIFTGFIAYDKDEGILNLPYVVDPIPFTDYFPKTINSKIPKLSLIWILNDINYPKMKKELKKIKVIKEVQYV